MCGFLEVQDNIAGLDTQRQVLIVEMGKDVQWTNPAKPQIDDTHLLSHLSCCDELFLATHKAIDIPPVLQFVFIIARPLGMQAGFKLILSKPRDIIIFYKAPMAQMRMTLLEADIPIPIGAMQAAERALAAGAAVEGEAPPGASSESSIDSEGKWSSDPENEDGEGKGQEDSIGAARKPCGKRKRAGIVLLDGS